MEQEISFERIPTHIFSDSDSASKSVAKEIADLIRKNNQASKPTILGLATGSSPKKVYQELIRIHREEGLSFKDVITFNLDEYHPMEPDSIQSYVRFMKEQLFDHIVIPVTNYHLPDGTLSLDKIPEFCRDYEAKIERLGGFDYYLLGIGRNGHIGFNEPGSTINSKTRLMTLDIATKIDASPDFGGLQKVPKKAITLGIDSIMKSKKIVLLAWGEHKADSVAKAVEGTVTSDIPASYLQLHPNASFILDETAASMLTRIKTPWVVDSVKWDRNMIKKAVTHLSLTLQKPVLKLTSKDYNEQGLSELLSLYGQAYEINIEVFNYLQHTITGWPGGKPNADDTHRPERAFPAKKKVLIFSPHPDDDIISMGGTFQRLHDQGHDVHVAYQTTGNIAVADDEALRFAEFVVDFNEKFESPNAKANRIYKEAIKFLRNKPDSEIDITAVREIKGLIRKGEAKNTCRFVGIKKENAHFLELPFYETGTIRKKPIGEKDIQIVMDLIEEIQPHQIYAAGDLADPHGTHKVCLDAIMEAVTRLKHREYMKNCWIWLYKGAWAEWDIDQIEMAVPMSPDQVFKKRMGIFKHQSQKDGVVFQGDDSREFWQRAEERNRATASIYNALGLAEYEAMEAFVRWKF
ncbi:MAG: glucosamine-6-phosphate deaminase [Aquirufa sp.]